MMETEDETEDEYYELFLKTKPKFNLDCYYCISELYCKEAHTWDTGEKECKNFRGG